MLNYHLICTVSVFFIFFSFLIFNIYIEAINLHGRLILETNLLNIEQHTHFNSYLVQFNKSYKDEEYFTRLQNFRESLEEISRLNNIDPSAKHGITQFSDMSREEFSRRMSINKFRTKCENRNFKCSLPKRLGLDDYTGYGEALEFPDTFDWRAEGIIGPVVDQKMCAACWAISAVGVMEAMLAKNRKYRESLSVQEMLDCTTNGGCGGGNMVEALKQLCIKYRNGSITTEDNYNPLIMIKEKCQRPRTRGLRTRVASFSRECKVSEKYYLPSLIANVGPVAAVINGGPLKSYIDGIIQFSCHRDPHGDELTDHAIQIVGYDTSSDIPYYIVKNSWGEGFGINGYVKIAMYHNVCGIADEVIHLNVITY